MLRKHACALTHRLPERFEIKGPSGARMGKLIWFDLARTLALGPLTLAR